MCSKNRGQEHIASNEPAVGENEEAQILNPDEVAAAEERWVAEGIVDAGLVDDSASMAAERDDASSAHSISSHDDLASPTLDPTLPHLTAALRIIVTPDGFCFYGAMAYALRAVNVGATWEDLRNGVIDELIENEHLYHVNFEDDACMRNVLRLQHQNGRDQNPVDIVIVAAANVYGVVNPVHTRGQVYITEPQEGRVLIPEPIELELDHQHYAARLGPVQEPSPPVLPSPDPEPEVVDLSLEDDALLDTDPLLTPEEVEEIVMEDVESQSPTVVPDPMVPDAPSVDSAVSGYPSREGQPSRPQSLVDRARKSPFAKILRRSQKTKQSQSVSQGARLVDNQKDFLRAVGSRLKPGEFTKAEGELWVDLYNRFLKRHVTAA